MGGDGWGGGKGGGGVKPKCKPGICMLPGKAVIAGNAQVTHVGG